MVFSLVREKTFLIINFRIYLFDLKAFETYVAPGSFGRFSRENLLKTCLDAWRQNDDAASECKTQCLRCTDGAVQ